MEERKKSRNAKLREARAKKSSKKAVEELKKMNLINEELEAKLTCYKGKTKFTV